MTLLEIENLTITFATARGLLAAVSAVSLSVASGEVVGLVGESGSGKSVTSRAVLGLLPASATVSGSIRLAGREILGMSARALRQVRGEQAAMVFQDPMTTLNPVFPVGEQVAETLRFHKGLGRAAADAEVVRLFERVGDRGPGGAGARLPAPALRRDASAGDDRRRDRLRAAAAAGR